MAAVKCEICGKKLDSFKVLNDKEGHGFIDNSKFRLFCSEKCKQEYRKKHKV